MTLPDGMFEKKLYSVDEVAARVGISSRVLRERLRKGEIEAFSFGKSTAVRWMIPRESLEKLELEVARDND